MGAEPNHKLTKRTETMTEEVMKIAKLFQITAPVAATGQRSHRER